MPDRTIATVAAGLTALTTIAIFFRRIFGALMAPVLWIVRQDQAAKTIKQIYAEVMPNGGGSLRDSVTRIERRGNLNEQITRAILSDAMHGVFQSDGAGRCVWVNAGYCRMVGRLPEDILGDGWESYIHPDDRGRVLGEWRSAVASKREFEMRYRFTNGSEVSAVAHPLRDELGRLMGYQGTVRIVENK